MENKMDIMKLPEYLLSTKRNEDTIMIPLALPYQEGECWDASPTHGEEFDSIDEGLIPSAIDFAPSLYGRWNVPFDDYGSDGLVTAAHDGLVKVHSTCSVEITLGSYSTYYGHVEVLAQDGSQIPAGTVIGKIELDPAKAACLCGVGNGGTLECSTGKNAIKC